MESMRKIEPVKPVAPYIGGKSRLAKTLIKHINSIPHMVYAEAFVGMGGVFLRRDIIPKSEVINDYNNEVSNLFRVLQEHYVALVDYMKFQLTSRSAFNLLIDKDPRLMTDIQRAARFLYLQKTAFGGRVSEKHFGVSRLRSASFNLSRLEPMLADVYERLNGVTIECLDYKDFIKRYDTEHTLFYLDPPYYMCEKDYGRDLFSRDEFPKMAELLNDIKGTFILSLNDHEQVRDIFKNFHIESVETTYTISENQNAKKVGEVIISNVKLDSGL